MKYTFRFLSLLAGMFLLLSVFFVQVAYAQVPTVTPTVPSAVSTATVIITLLAIVTGYIGNAVQSGSFLGMVTVPKAWVPYLTLLSGFLAAVVVSISSAPTVNGAAWVQAALAGLIALGGTVVGVTAHQHLNQGADDSPAAPAVKVFPPHKP